LYYPKIKSSLQCFLNLHDFRCLHSEPNVWLRKGSENWGSWTRLWRVEITRQLNITAAFMRNTMSDREIFRKSRVLKNETSFCKMKQSIYKWHTIIPKRTRKHKHIEQTYSPVYTKSYQKCLKQSLFICMLSIYNMS
jgi:hypothetical protein